MPRTLVPFFVQKSTATLLQLALALFFPFFIFIFIFLIIIILKFNILLLSLKHNTGLETVAKVDVVTNKPETRVAKKTTN